MDEEKLNTLTMTISKKKEIEKLHVCLCRAAAVAQLLVLIRNTYSSPAAALFIQLQL